MPNILKRPMFRKGGSTSYGTGITANLEPRTNYEGGGGTGYEDIINRQYQSMLPSQGDLVSNFITGFGASAPQDPMQLQTWGSAFGSAGRTAAALRAKQEAPAIEYRKQAGIQAIKNLTKKDEAKITAAMTNAREFARVNYQNYPGSTPEEKMQNAYKSKFSELLSKERAVTSEAELIRQKENEFRASEKVRMNPRKAAETAVKINEGKIKIPGGYTGVISVTSQGLSDIIPQGDGTTAVLNTKKSGININNVSYQPNQNYIDPQTGAVYQYQGKGTFKRVYP
jgi:hypothetical protein